MSRLIENRLSSIPVSHKGGVIADR